MMLVFGVFLIARV